MLEPREISAVEQDGCGLLRGVVPAALIDDAAEQTASPARAGLRNPLRAVPALADIARCEALTGIVSTLLGGDAVLTRAILFDKTADRNWPVHPHRDTTVAVAARIETPGFGPWSVKSGVVHVRPPDEVLSRMWTLRVAIDPAPASNGPLRVVPGSHRESRETKTWRVMACEPGDVVLMKPLLMHASDRATSPSRRRVLHLEWAPDPLPSPLRWASIETDDVSGQIE